MIPYGRQDISDEDVAAVAAVLRSDFLTQGPVILAFEKSVADYCGAKHAVAMNSATSALHIACMALDAGAGDLVWTTPNTFVATANCACYCGADVDFVDMDPLTFNMSVDLLSEKLEQAARAGRLPKVVIPVHFSGQSADMRAIGALRKKYGFKVIEDASHAIGARYENVPVGRCTYSDIAVFSLHPVKIITSGEGGLALTNDDALFTKLSQLRTHGITRVESEMQQDVDGPWYYEMNALGYNYRMTDIQAALGLNQMKRLDEFVAKRHHLAKRYDELLPKLPLILPVQTKSSHSSLHLYVVQIDNRRTNLDRRTVFEKLRELGIGVNVHYIPVHVQPYYRALGFKPGDFPASEAYYKNAISIPLYSAMTESQQDRVVEALGEALA
jgi:UDP-4-amino-4,6-dideoxy-N-acetyl-beta-L-altrosamine transaminase